jgi:hypothetical protein
MAWAETGLSRRADFWIGVAVLLAFGVGVFWFVGYLIR